jgi:hypothetical protein
VSALKSEGKFRVIEGGGRPAPEPHVPTSPDEFDDLEGAATTIGVSENVIAAMAADRKSRMFEDKDVDAAIENFDEGSETILGVGRVRVQPSAKPAAQRPPAAQAAPVRPTPPPQAAPVRPTPPPPAPPPPLAPPTHARPFPNTTIPGAPFPLHQPPASQPQPHSLPDPASAQQPPSVPQGPDTRDSTNDWQLPAMPHVLQTPYRPTYTPMSGVPVVPATPTTQPTPTFEPTGLRQPSAPPQGNGNLWLFAIALFLVGAGGGIAAYLIAM